jgi:hypothetical protein
MTLSIKLPAKHRKFKGRVLVPSAQSNLLSRRQVGDSERYRFDGDLLDALHGIVPEKIFNEVLASCKDERCTKQFYHLEPMERVVEEFLQPESFNPLRRAEVRAALVYLRKIMPMTKLRPLSVDDAEIILTNKKGVVGSIGTGTKGDNIELCQQYARIIERSIAEGKPYDEISIPATMGHRAQLGSLTEGSYLLKISYNPSFNMKDRVVWVIDGGTVLFEGKYAKPLYEFFKERLNLYVGGKDPETLRYMIHQGRKNANWWLGTDISHFDASLPKELINVCFEIVSDYFDDECRRELDWIRFNFTHTALFVPNQGFFVKDHGVPSGSAFTQIVGTLANCIINLSSIVATAHLSSVTEMVSWLEREFGNHQYQYALFGMGDDFLLFPRNYRITEDVVNEVSTFIGTTFGMKVNPQKCAWGYRLSDPHFLKREWRSGGEWQEPVALLVNVVHPEHDRWYKEYSPYHILYGLFLTYKATFSKWVTEDEIISLMEAHGGIDRLREIELYNMPGVVRGLGENPTKWMANRAHYRRYLSRNKSS